MWLKEEEMKMKKRQKDFNLTLAKCGTYKEVKLQMQEDHVKTMWREENLKVGPIRSYNLQRRTKWKRCSNIKERRPLFTNYVGPTRYWRNKRSLGRYCIEGRKLRWRLLLYTWRLLLQTCMTEEKKNRKKRRGAELQHLREQKRKEKEAKSDLLNDIRRFC